MLRQVRIQNFKAWKDTGPVKLAPLTILFGSNSSGKSSINHLLMMLKQSVQSPDRNSVFDFGDANAPVQLGSFRDVLFNHDLSRQLEFDLEWDLPGTFTIRDPRSRGRYSGDRLSFHAAAHQQKGRARAPRSEGFEYKLLQSGDLTLSVAMRRDEKRTDRWNLETEKYKLIRNPGRAWELPKPVQFYGFPNETGVYFQNSGFLSELELSLENQLQKLAYLGPLRVPPKRLYSWVGSIPEDVGWQGQNAIQALLAASDRGFNWRPRSPRVAFEEVIGKWLQTMGLLQQFAVSEIAPERSEYEVRVSTSKKARVNITDVGFGVSQVLPVLVQAFYAEANSTVLMEQPEIHLHPAVQADLADVFIEAITARESGRRRGIQLIIESHSEHLLRRLQRRVAEEKISSDEVALYFCYPGAEGSDIEQLELNDTGDILNWPPDFFGDELEDVAVQAEVGMQRKLHLGNV